MDAKTQLRGPVAQGFLTPGPSVAEASHFQKSLQRVQLQVTNLVVTVVTGTDYASAVLCTWPDDNIYLMACEVNLKFTKGNTAGGIVAATGVDLGIGTAAASNVALTSTMVNIIAATEADAGTLTDVFQVHNLAATPAPLGILEGSSNSVYLNMASDSVSSATDTLTFNGTVDLYYFTLGNIVS